MDIWILYVVLGVDGLLLCAAPAVEKMRQCGVTYKKTCLALDRFIRQQILCVNTALDIILWIQKHTNIYIEIFVLSDRQSEFLSNLAGSVMRTMVDTM